MKVARALMPRASALFHRWQIGANAFPHFGRHAYGFTQGRVRMDGLADIQSISTHLQYMGRQVFMKTKVAAPSCINNYWN